MSFYFGEFELDQERRQLLREGEPVPLEPKAYELLNLLLERRPRALSRAHIRDANWAGTYVSESTLGVAVNAIRQALGDEARKPRFIRTVHGFGYAFCGEARESAGDRREPADRLAVEARPSSDVSPREEAKPIDGPFPGPSAMASPPRWRLAVIGAGVLVLLAGGWLAIRRMKSSDVPARVPAPKVVPLTSLPGAELHPALSPDGTRVAFIWDGPDRDNFDVYVKDIPSGEMVRVRQDGAPDYRPVWSPDGQHLAFLRGRETGVAVFAVSVGGQEQRLADIVEPVTFLGFRSSWVHWSPDGRFLAVADRVSDEPTWGIVLVSVETGEKRTLIANMEALHADLFPTFSPDGRRLAFLRGRPSVVPERWDLVVQPLSTGIGHSHGRCSGPRSDRALDTGTEWRGGDRRDDRAIRHRHRREQHEFMLHSQLHGQSRGSSRRHAGRSLLRLPHRGPVLRRHRRRRPQHDQAGGP